MLETCWLMSLRPFGMAQPPGPQALLPDLGAQACGSSWLPCGYSRELRPLWSAWAAGSPPPNFPQCDCLALSTPRVTRGFSHTGVSYKLNQAPK